jgi:hypothetical protein
MGYQLWTSPITGYRRRGTRLADFRKGFADTIKVQAIFEPLQSCPIDAYALEMYEQLGNREFDIAGVKHSADEPVIGYVRREKLTSGLVRDHIEMITHDDYVSESMSIDPLLTRLCDRPFVFVSVDSQIVGILTLADLNKPLVRVYFFGLISLLEIHLSFWISQQYPDDDAWQGQLSPARVARAQKTQTERSRRRQALSLADCLQFADKRDLIVNSNHLRETLQLGSKTKSRHFLGDVENLRNTLAHSQYDLVQGGTWSSLIDLVQRVMKVIEVSDHCVEKHASAMAGNFLGALW